MNDMTKTCGDTKPALHPLDPLTLEELCRAGDILRREKGLGETARFPYLMLNEPAKAEVLAHRPGQTFRREAYALVLDRASEETHEAIVDLGTNTILSWTRLDIEARGQAPIMIEEFDSCVDIVRADPDWRAAVARRGLSDADIDRIQAPDSLILKART